MERFVDDAQQLAHAVRVRLVSYRTFTPPDIRPTKITITDGHRPLVGEKFSVMGLLFGIIFGVIRTGLGLRLQELRLWVKVSVWG